MNRKSTKQARLERQNREWREALLNEVGHCQNPFCGRRDILSVHEIPRGVHRAAAYSQRLACMVLCWTCNSEAFTDYSIWPIERQAALQAILCAPIASPQEVLDCLNRCRGRTGGAITWADIAPYLTLQL